MKKTMFPRSFVEWKDRNYYCIGAIYAEKIKGGEGVIISFRDVKRFVLDDLYKHWLFEVEPKTKEDEKE